VSQPHLLSHYVTSLLAALHCHILTLLSLCVTFHVLPHYNTLHLLSHYVIFHLLFHSQENYICYLTYHILSHCVTSNIFLFNVSTLTISFFTYCSLCLTDTSPTVSLCVTLKLSIGSHLPYCLTFINNLIYYLTIINYILSYYLQHITYADIFSGL
jgi:hypothetical protein